MSNTQQLLTRIAENTSSQPDNQALWVAAVSAGAVVAGSLISSLITYAVTNRTNSTQMDMAQQRLKAEVVSRERLRWLQDLRGRLATLYAQMDMQYALIKQPMNTDEIYALQEKLNAYSLEIMEQVNNITLLLNPEKEGQGELHQSLQEVLGYMQKCFRNTKAEAQDFDDAFYQRIKTNAFNSATLIGSKAWKKVQELE